MADIILWDEWCKAFSVLREAFSRQTTYLWAAVFCIGIMVRTDNRGVSSIVGSLGLSELAYGSLLRLCHLTAVDLDKLMNCWVRLCLRLFRPICIDGYMILLGDAVKVGKEGRKMPAVKLMHQSSSSNTKAEYIMGHYLQSLSLAVCTPTIRVAAVPLITQIHDGLVFSNRSRETSIDRFAKMVRRVSDAADILPITVADSFYAVKSMIAHTEDMNGHLVSRVANNAVAYEPAIAPKLRKRGRPAKKGAKVILASVFEFLEYSEDGYSYSCRDLYWPPAQKIIRFVVCKSKRGKAILMSTNLDLDPETIIKVYEKRWLIETGFKSSVHNIGSFGYHFWMKGMKPIKGRPTKQYLHRETKEYRSAIKRKIHAFHTYLALANVSHGLMMHLAINFREQVWLSFNGWLRTIRKDVEPSEIVVANALRSTLPKFLGGGDSCFSIAKFIRDRKRRYCSGEDYRAA